MKNEDIDKQFYKKFTYGGVTGRVSFDPDKDRPFDVLDFIHQIVQQIREEDAQIAEERKINMDRRDRIYKYQMDNNQRWYDKGQNDACDDIAKAIRGK